jgi:hypothetical protein
MLQLMKEKNQSSFFVIEDIISLIIYHASFLHHVFFKVTKKIKHKTFCFILIFQFIIISSQRTIYWIINYEIIVKKFMKFQAWRNCCINSITFASLVQIIESNTPPCQETFQYYQSLVGPHGFGELQPMLGRYQKKEKKKVRII